MKLSDLSKYYLPHHFFLTGVISFSAIFFFNLVSLIHYFPYRLWFENGTPIFYQLFYLALTFYFFKMFNDTRSQYMALRDVKEDELDEIFKEVENEQNK